MKKRGFTLIELLIVIGILAILATVVILVLNPAEILAQARDSQRLSDLSSIKSAIALYLATNQSPPNQLQFGGITATITVSGGPACSTIFTAGQCTATSTTSSTAPDGTGWVRVPFQNTSGGSSLSALPIDPLTLSPAPSIVYFYAYTGGSSTNGTFKMVGRLESVKYRGLMTNDGGTQNTCPSTFQESGCYYEVGTGMAL